MASIVSAALYQQREIRPRQAAGAGTKAGSWMGSYPGGVGVTVCKLGERIRCPKRKLRALSALGGPKEQNANQTRFATYYGLNGQERLLTLEPLVQEICQRRAADLLQLVLHAPARLADIDQPA